ncbi:MAG: thioredoxin family protein [Flavobacteriales bacterium]|nr:thioredoxin family protein [Flavobacteriia bacterium]NCP05739.1 thioredoxin family protein [Flavobacteriales bacterium]PIV94531.1 MAG: thioredoxin family protein [Flavobacteriaceae bacterium CG17_big_fil_post_rev_8_21_14_2_50_33_15]PIY10674.1 MAG: thioredoxin family protein [Flavobacteriaceae bacterium CG_4_10_14_3_um_filter_33_47]PJB18138.1 MAG: thioredoxin family protein [Flavobacteriaceae bacterium CG_4_9_14_3_um_filter_33_16]
MNYKIIVLVVLAFSLNATAQEWLTDIESAKEIALKNKSKIVLVFQGSDWCAPCIKLDNEVWSTPEFKTLSKNHFVMLKADFPRRKANKLSEEQTIHNAKLAERYNKQGFFPLVVVLDAEGHVLGKIGYEKISPKAYFEKLTSFK